MARITGPMNRPGVQAEVKAHDKDLYAHKSIGFVAHHPTGLSVPSSSWTDITNLTQDWANPEANFVASTGIFTIPYTGIWLLTATGTWGGYTTTAHKLVSSWISFDGGAYTEDARTSAEINSTGAQGSSLSYLKLLTRGDKVKYAVWQDNGATQVMAATPTTQIGALLIQRTS